MRSIFFTVLELEIKRRFFRPHFKSYQPAKNKPYFRRAYQLDCYTADCFKLPQVRNTRTGTGITAAVGATQQAYLNFTVVRYS